MTKRNHAIIPAYIPKYDAIRYVIIVTTITFNAFFICFCFSPLWPPGYPGAQDNGFYVGLVPGNSLCVPAGRTAPVLPD